MEEIGPRKTKGLEENDYEEDEEFLKNFLEELDENKSF